METLFALATVILTTAVSTQAERVSGHFRGNGTYVSSYYRTPANGTPYDNLSYRGYPSQQPGYISPRSYGFDSSSSRTMPSPSSGSYNLSTMPSNYQGDYAPKPLIGLPRSSSFGF